MFYSVFLVLSDSLSSAFHCFITSNHLYLVSSFYFVLCIFVWSIFFSQLLISLVSLQSLSIRFVVSYLEWCALLSSPLPIQAHQSRASFQPDKSSCSCLDGCAVTQRARVALSLLVYDDPLSRVGIYVSHLQ
jgi:hypothetical protein